MNAELKPDWDCFITLVFSHLANPSGTEADSEDGNGTQVALEYALSDSASLTVSYNEDMDGDDDDDYDAGTSASIGFKF